MWEMEEELHPETKTLIPRGRPKKGSENLSICDVCLGSKNLKENQLLFCTSCKIRTHFNCTLLKLYHDEKELKEVRELLVNEQYTCSACQAEDKEMAHYHNFIPPPTKRSSIVFGFNPDLFEKSQKRKSSALKKSKLQKFNSKETNTRLSSVQCSLCPDINGALSYIDKQNLWVHFTCVYWIKEIDFYFQIPNQLTEDLRKDVLSKRTGVCSICRVDFGVTIPCEENKCSVWFHPRCARLRGIIQKKERVPKLKYNVLCLEHLKEYDKAEYKSREAFVAYPGFPHVIIDEGLNGSSSLVQDPRKREGINNLESPIERLKLKNKVTFLLSIPT